MFSSYLEESAFLINLPVRENRSSVCKTYKSYIIAHLSCDTCAFYNKNDILEGLSLKICRMPKARIGLSDR